MAERRMCRFCQQELAHAAYFRHLHDTSGTICPGRQSMDHEENHRGYESSELHVDRVSSTVSDEETGQNTRDFTGQQKGTDVVEDVCDENVQFSGSDDESSMQCSGFSSSSSDGYYTSSSDGEVWEESDLDDNSTEAEVSPAQSSLLFGISFFVYFFHLFYRLSEKGTIALLSFLKNLFVFLARVCNSPLLMNLSQSLPKSVQSIRKHFR